MLLVTCFFSTLGSELAGHTSVSEPDPQKHIFFYTELWGGQRRCVLAIKGKTPGSILQDLSTVRALFGLLRPRGVQVVAAAVVLMVDELGQVPGALVVKLEG